MKSKQIIAALMLASSMLVGCSSTKEKVEEVNPPLVSDQLPGESVAEDVITSSSRAVDEATLLKAAGKTGSWIVIVQKDLTVDKEIVLEGDFTTPDKTDTTKLVPAGRKLALYDQNDKKEITANYTLKAPKLTIISSDTTIKGGTFVGDIYVQGKNLTLTDTKIEGNIYFKNKEAQDTFKIGNNASVTGVTELKQ